MITYENAEAAHNNILCSDIEYARLKALFHGLTEQRKTIRALCYQKQTGSAADKLQAALASKEYIDHLDKIHDAELEFLTLHENRNSANRTCDMWRSVNSSMKLGKI